MSTDPRTILTHEPDKWAPLYSEPADVPGDGVWFVCRGLDDHDVYYETQEEAQVEADRLNALEAERISGEPLPAGLDPAQLKMVAEAFEEGRLSIQVDAPLRLTSRVANFEGRDDLVTDDVEHHVRIVHVISRPQRGEIRGYVEVDGDGRLRLRTPVYPPNWPELDYEVGKRWRVDMLQMRAHESMEETE